MVSVALHYVLFMREFVTIPDTIVSTAFTNLANTERAAGSEGISIAEY